ncbi:MAG: DUF3099 domain-containing protein [Nocardioidaceae bacterium]
MARMSPRGEPVRITTAQTSHLDEIKYRQKRYLISMGIRTACVIAAVVASGPLRWVFIIGAVVLPYVAVVMANAGARLDRDAPAPYVDDGRLLPGPDDRPVRGPEDRPDPGDDPGGGPDDTGDHHHK